MAGADCGEIMKSLTRLSSCRIIKSSKAVKRKAKQCLTSLSTPKPPRCARFLCTWWPQIALFMTWAALCGILRRVRLFILSLSLLQTRSIITTWWTLLIMQISCRNIMKVSLRVYGLACLSSMPMIILIILLHSMVLRVCGPTMHSLTWLLLIILLITILMVGLLSFSPLMSLLRMYGPVVQISLVLRSMFLIALTMVILLKRAIPRLAQRLFIAISHRIMTLLKHTQH